MHYSLSINYRDTWMICTACSQMAIYQTQLGMVSVYLLSGHYIGGSQQVFCCITVITILLLMFSLIVFVSTLSLSTYFQIESLYFFGHTYIFPWATATLLVCLLICSFSLIAINLLFFLMKTVLSAFKLQRIHTTKIHS